MTVIVTDSSVDLPPAEAERLGIVVAPLTVAFSDAILHDDGLGRADFYRRLEGAQRTPMVSGASADGFIEALEKVKARGEKEVVALVMSVGSSFTYVAMEVAVRRVHELEYSIVNTGRSLAGQAALAIAAAEAAQRGVAREAIVRLIEDLSGSCDTYLVPAGLEYLRRSDQLTTLSQGPAGRLDGSVPVLRVRGKLTAVAKAADTAAATATMLELVANSVDAGREQIAVVVHAVAPEAAAWLARELRQRINCREPLITELGPTVGTYLGPGTVGVGYCPVPE